MAVIYTVFQYSAQHLFHLQQGDGIFSLVGAISKKLCEHN
jgi:hypothetical protein